MIPLNFLRLRKQVPDKGPPKADLVDVAYNPTTGKIGAIDANNDPVLFDGAGAGSTAELTTSDGSAAAAAGKLGEYLESKVAFGAAVALTTTDPENITTLALTAGAWDVEGVVTFLDAAASTTLRGAIVSTSSETFISDGSESYAGPVTTTQDGNYSASVTRRRVRVEAPTTIYLVASAFFSAGAISAYGMLTASRVH